MSVSSNDRFKSTAGDGVTVDFDIDFPFASTSEVIVATVTAGVRTVLASGYTIAATAKTYASDATYPGGTITFTTAPAVGTTVQRYGETASTQAVTIPSDATLFSSGVQNIVDKLTRLYQEAKRELGFTVQVTPGTAQVTIPPITDGPGYIYTDGTNPYEIVDAVDASTLTVGGDTTGYVPFWSGTMSLTGLINFFYTTATKTLRLRGSTTVTDHTLKLQNDAGTDVATFRSDGVETANTDLTTKGYVDTASGNAAVIAKVLTGFASGAGTVSAADSILGAIQKIDGNVTAGPSALARSSGLVTVGNTVTETTLLSFTLAAGALSTNRAVRIKLFGIWSHDGDATNTCTFRLKYGATTFSMGAMILVSAAPVTNQPMWLEYEIRANNSASAQIALAVISRDSDDNSNDYGTATEASAGALTVAVTAQWGTADSSETVSLASEAILY